MQLPRRNEDYELICRYLHPTDDIFGDRKRKLEEGGDLTLEVEVSSRFEFVRVCVCVCVCVSVRLPSLDPCTFELRKRCTANTHAYAHIFPHTSSRTHLPAHFR